MRSAALIYNPIAGRRKATRRAQVLSRCLLAAGFETEVLGTRGPGDATGLAKEFAKRGVEAVFVLGGDGTVREVATGLLGTSTILGILPGGSTNVLARALGLPLDPFTVARRSDQLVPTPIDVGLCNGEPFLMMASCGLDARVLERQGSPLKRILGRAGIVLLGLGEWLRYRYPRIHGSADGRAFSASFLAVCNIPLYGGPFRLAPDARFDDGFLDLVLFDGQGRRSSLGFARDVAFGRHQKRKDVVLRRVRSVQVSLPPAACLQVDGDALGRRDGVAEISLAQDQVKVLAPIRPLGAP